MPLDGFRLSIFGDVQANRQLGTIKGRMGDPQPLFYALTGWMARVQKRQFNTEGKAGSGGWQELAASTLAQKKAAGLDMRILRATGRLFRSWTEPTADAVRIVDSSKMVFGTTVPWAKYHQPDRQERRELELARQQRRTFSRALLRFIGSGQIRIGR